MGIKDFLKPTIFKISIFIFFGVVFLYAKESVSAIGFSFAIFYNAYGFPFQHLITGDIDSLSGIINTLFLGNFFTRYGSFLFNPTAFAVDIILIYLLACFMAVLFRNMKVKP